MSDRHEARMLLAVLGERWDDASRLARARPVDPGRFTALCVRCDVHPQVHARLARAGAESLVGGDAIATLTSLRKKVRNDNLLLLASFERIVDLLRARGITPVALKGIDVLHRFCRSFDERTMDDIDLLVRPRQRDAAIAALEEAGWSGPTGEARNHWLRSSYEVPLTSPGPVTVVCEIHWSLAQDVRYAVDSDTVIDRAKPLSAAGRQMLRLDDHDAAAHLLLHHVQHYFDRRLKWVLDVGAIAAASTFSWKTVAQRLDTWGGRQAGALALAHVRKLFPTLLGGAAFAALPASRLRLALSAPLRSTHPLDFYRGTRRRAVQLAIAAIALEHPSRLPRYVRHRAVRDHADPGAARS